MPRLEALAHAAETLMGKFRDGSPATGEAVTLILATIDRIKGILEALEREQREPEGADSDLISDLERMAAQVSAPATARHPVGTLAPQVLERPLLPGEDALDDLELAFGATRGRADRGQAGNACAPDIADDDERQETQTNRSASPSIRSNS